MFRPIVRMAAAVFVAGIIAFAITAAPAANDHEAKSTQLQPFAKSDRLHVAARRIPCSLHGWPNFEPKCQFDVRKSAGEARTVRVIALR